MYIVEADSQERESEAIRHLVGSFQKDILLRAFGLDDLTWIIIEALKPQLTPGISGDVDILAGNLDFKDWAAYRAALATIETSHPHFPHALRRQLAGKMVSEADGLAWPPVPSFVVGIEVKCAYFTTELEAAKSSAQKVKGIRKQVDWLGRMGLDHFGLLDVIGNQPSFKKDGGYLGALERSVQSQTAMWSILAERLPPESRAAHFVWSAGAVGGGDERIRGTGQPLLLRKPRANPRVEAGNPETLTHRAALLSNIPIVLAHLPAPRYFPVVFVDCRICQSIHYLDDPMCQRKMVAP